jgi:hypothetical protein
MLWILCITEISLEVSVPNATRHDIRSSARICCRLDFPLNVHARLKSTAAGGLLVVALLLPQRLTRAVEVFRLLLLAFLLLALERLDLVPEEKLSRT